MYMCPAVRKKKSQGNGKRVNRKILTKGCFRQNYSIAMTIYNCFKCLNVSQAKQLS